MSWLTKTDFLNINLFADLISFHLNALDAVRNIETKLAAEQIFNLELEKKVFERTIELEKSNKELLKINKELQSFDFDQLDSTGFLIFHSHSMLSIT